MSRSGGSYEVKGGKKKLAQETKEAPQETTKKTPVENTADKQGGS